MPRLHAGNYAQLFEAWNVVGVQTFNVHQFIAAVARAIALLSVFDCIQRGPNPSITNRVNENLKVHLVDASYDVSELIGRIVELSPRIRTIRVWFKHGGRVRLDHVVDVQLYRGYPEVIVVVLLPSVREVVEGLWGCPSPVEKRHLQTYGQVAILLQLDVCIQVLQIGLRVDHSRDSVV